ncbi:MAG: hypothetical protein Q9M32_00715 [Sulfurimonas sp.]|nr:hypothetical protein [Sulfurimonas sp.]MDQ7061015.1 hypothetical protein [Sulfurimonas sp.]
MKIKSIITLALLFTMSFSVVHEYVFAFYDNDHCNVEEYISELEAPSHHGDICDIHFEYHVAYILPSAPRYQIEVPQKNSFHIDKEIYLSFNSLQLYKPPIS